MSVVTNPRHAHVARRRPSVRSLLVVAEIALSLMLVIGACLLMRSFWHLSHVDSGLDPSGVVTASVSLPEARYQDAEPRAAFFSELVESLQRVHDIEIAAATTVLPFTGFHSTAVEIPDRDNEKIKGIERRHITPNYFQATGIRLLEGRGLRAGDATDSEVVVVVNERFALQVFPNVSALGKRVDWEARDGRHQMRIVGVVGNVKDMGLDQEVRPTMYLHIRQAYSPDSMSLVVRTQTASADVEKHIRAALRRLDPALPVYEVAPLEQLLSNSFGTRRFSTLLLGLFAAAALLLAVVGIYGVVSHIVGQRRFEIGVRIALGSEPAEIVRLVVRQGMVTAGVGMTLGVVLALAASRLLRSHLFGIGAFDPQTFLGVLILIGAVSLFACYLPARRAAAVDPALFLRNE